MSVCDVFISLSLVLPVADSTVYKVIYFVVVVIVIVMLQAKPCSRF